MFRSKIAQSSVVLVVEDEPLLRMHAVDLLEEAGLTTIEAGDADEAVRILAARSDIRVVFTDIHMPGTVDGLMLAAAIRDRWPPIEVVVTSGFFARVSADMIPPRTRFLPKPYGDDQLVRVVASMMTEPQPA